MSESPYVLGLDIGVASIGWALIDLDEDGRPVGIRRAGTHLFEAGVEGGKLDPETAMTRGKEQSKAKPRRDARAMRRQGWRRRRRKKKLLAVLMKHGLLPEGDIHTSEHIDVYVKDLDRRLREKWAPPKTSHIDHQNLPYRLRAAAAVGPVERMEFGRALYHLAQRRGFLSNRKTPERDDDTSEVKEAIGDLAEKIQAHDPPTLGAYLASLDPDDERLRARWTGRETMQVPEFERMWSVQAGAHGLSDEAREDIFDAIFYQRPLKDQRHLIGRCSLTGKQRAPIGLRIAQRFRVLQQVNHLRVVSSDRDERALSAEERSALVEALCREGDLTVAKAKTAAGLARGSHFSIEEAGEKRLVGHRTDAKLRAIFGERWDGMSEDDREAVVEDVRSVREPETLERIGRQRWGLAAEAAADFAAVTLEEGHSRHSAQALRRLVERMEDGTAYATARKDVFPGSFLSEEAHDTLPPVEKWDADLRNPSVTRALTELRKLVNAVVRRYGKPERIHIELARDLKQGRSRREKINRRMREREKERSQAAEGILRELGWSDPKGWQITKWLLAEECGWQCPFTGREFGAQQLMGSSAQFDVEHIWPFSKSLDNSFLNKTICYHEENRNRKKGHTPKQAYGGAEYEAILQRVRAFKGDRFAAREKLRRFTEDMDTDFTNRHLVETRYIGRLACEYLGLLYGGRVQDQGEVHSSRRIITPSGRLTAWLRRGWGLDSVLSERNEKERHDHRHHAIDAIVIAIANQRMIQRITEAALRMEREGRERPFDRIETPWDGFDDDVRAAIEAVVVSHRQSRKARGKLHEDTLYSKDYNGRRRVRKAIDALTKTDIHRERIVDPRVRAAVAQKLEVLGESDPQKAFKDPVNAPVLRGADGQNVRLRHVRIEVRENPRRFGSAERGRYANTGANHHARLMARRDRNGRVSGWQDEVASLAEILDSEASGSVGGDADFIFSISANEYLELDSKWSQGRVLCRVLNLSGGDIELREHWDGRTKKDLQAEGRLDRVSGSQLFKRNARKVHVNYLGEVRDAGG